MDIMKEEIFGPIVCIDTFKTEEEAIEKASQQKGTLEEAIQRAMLQGGLDREAPGVFWMAVDDFLAYFVELTVCRVLRDRVDARVGPELRPRRQPPPHARPRHAISGAQSRHSAVTRAAPEPAGQAPPRPMNLLD